MVLPVLLLMGYLVERMLVSQGSFQSSTAANAWAMGLNFFLTGIIVTVVAYFVGDYSRHSSRSLPLYSPLEDGLDMGLMSDGIKEIGSGLSENLQAFITEPSEDDHFCYLPLNWCGLAFILLGIVLMLVGTFAK